MLLKGHKARGRQAYARLADNQTAKAAVFISIAMQFGKTREGLARPAPPDITTSVSVAVCNSALLP